MSMKISLATIALALLCGPFVGCNQPAPQQPVPATTVTPAVPAATTVAATATATGQRDDWAQGRELFYALITRQTKSTAAASDYWTKVRATDPSAVPAAYLGATTMMTSAYESWLPTKGKLARQGLELMDAAVAAEPANVEVRFLRGMTSYNLPGFFKRGQIAADDLAFVATHATAAVTSGALNKGQAAAGLYHHGLLRAGAGDQTGARAAWKEAVQIAPDSSPGQAAAKELAKR